MSLRPRTVRRLIVALLLLGVGGTLILPPSAIPQGTLSALETDVDRVARDARPSVVTVFAHRTVSRRTRDGTTRPRMRTRVGSGVAVDHQWILTTASVVSEGQQLWIRTTNDLQAPVEVVGADPVFNVALLRVKDLRLPPLSFSSGRSPNEGEWVMAIGTSHFRARITQSVGTIAYRHREPRVSLLQLTNSVYPGYSGGAVLNARGELIGIVHGELGYDRDRGGGRSTFVIPSETVRPVYESLRSEGRVRHGYLGVSTSAASVESDTEPGLSVPIGARVESVQAPGPAARMGLRAGDLIVGFEGERVEYPDQLARWVAASRPGSVVHLVWVRDEIQQGGRVALSESPDPAPWWAVAASEPPAPERPESSARIADLERQIQRLNRELERLKGEANLPPH